MQSQILSSKIKIQKELTCPKYFRHVRDPWIFLHLFSFSLDLFISLILTDVNQNLFDDVFKKPNITIVCKTLNMTVAASLDFVITCIDLNRERFIRNSKYILNKPWPSTLRRCGGRRKHKEPPIATGRVIKAGR